VLLAVGTVAAVAVGSSKATITGAPIPTVVVARTKRGSSISNMPRRSCRERELEFFECRVVCPKRPKRDFGIQSFPMVRGSEELWTDASAPHGVAPPTRRRFTGEQRPMLPHYEPTLPIRQMNSTIAGGSPPCRNLSNRSEEGGRFSGLEWLVGHHATVLGPASQALDVFAHDDRKRLGGLDGCKNVLGRTFRLVGKRGIEAGNHRLLDFGAA